MRLDGEEDGFARVHVERRSGRLLGATLVARHAGDMIGEMSLAITAHLGIGALASTIHPYPTQAEVWKRLGDQWNRTRLTPRVHKVLTRYLSSGGGEHARSGKNLRVRKAAPLRRSHYREIAVPYRRRRAGSSKVSGTLRGTAGAAFRILGLLAWHDVIRPRLSG